MFNEFKWTTKNHSSISNLNNSLTVVLKTSEIFIASNVEGIYLSASIELPLKTDQEMIALNVTSLVGLTKLFGLHMVKAKRGKIMNVSSLLSFLPLPYFSVYSVTKSFLLAFTESLSVELEPIGDSAPISTYLTFCNLKYIE